MPRSPETLRKLLIVEDNDGYRRILERSLQRQGFVVQATGDVDEALILASIHHPAYVLLDLNLGGRSGLTLIQPLLALSPQARIVMLTGYASIPTTVTALKLGAAHYLAKPIDVAAIVSALLEDRLEIPEMVDDSDLMSVKTVEWEYIQRVLAENGGNISITARALKMHRRTLQRKLAKHRHTPQPTADQ
jgi:two-component system, response regulator RegA